MGFRPRPYPGWRDADPGAGYVRAFLPHGLWCESCGLRRCVHAEHPLGKGRRSLRRREQVVGDNPARLDLANISTNQSGDRHEMDYPGAPQDRPHRLPVAHRPVH
ncbi:protein of unknown function [Cupriavidus neocaledonicus]|uniref:Uncharacterized protein n=1 Tax=Cupriavidus neocaledonicus TaxID=1040979 RepID=A0A375H8E8_9BURK|nr:hypothetical protein CBM2605_B100366 [Cupriavidus neocaledonicus]SPD46743.1 protein of unknown function [Cupriavidus neocaledonicus]